MTGSESATTFLAPKGLWLLNSLKAVALTWVFKPAFALVIDNSMMCWRLGL